MTPNNLKWLFCLISQMKSFGVIWDHLESFKSWGDKISYTVNMQLSLSFFVGCWRQCIGISIKLSATLSRHQPQGVIGIKASASRHQHQGMGFKALASRHRHEGIKAALTSRHWHQGISIKASTSMHRHQCTGINILASGIRIKALASSHT